MKNKKSKDSLIISEVVIKFPEKKRNCNLGDFWEYIRRKVFKISQFLTHSNINKFLRLHKTNQFSSEFSYFAYSFIVKIVAFRRNY